MCLVYILLSACTGKYYYGHTENISDRLERHNSGRSKATKHGIPWALIALKEFPSKGVAMAFELKLKKCKDPARALELIGNNGLVK